MSTKLLGGVLGLPVMEREELFLAGLLHDLGKVPFGDEYIEVLNVARFEQIPLREVEIDLMGIDHQEVGLLIAQKWKLNKVISNCIGKHHDVEQLSFLDDKMGKQIALVALGDFYANVYDHGFAGNPFPREEDAKDLLDFVGLNWDEYCSIGNSLIEEIHKAEIFLRI